MTDVDGWSQIQNGSLVEGVYEMYNNAVLGNFLLVLFCTLSATLYLKTKNAVLCFVLGVLFFTIFYSFLTPFGSGTISLILVFELAVALYDIFWKA